MAFFSNSVGYLENIMYSIFQRASCFWVPNEKQTIKGLIFQKPSAIFAVWVTRITSHS